MTLFTGYLTKWMYKSLHSTWLTSTFIQEANSTGWPSPGISHGTGVFMKEVKVLELN